MTDHDPLCVSQEFLPADLTRFCDCERVARIRADEREKCEPTAEQVEEYATALRVKIEAEVRERIAQEPCSHDLSMHDAKIRERIAQKVRDAADREYGPYLAPVVIDLAARILKGGESE